MLQRSLFSAEARAPRTGDLAGLLCGPGQIARFGAGDQARLSIVLPDAGRAPPLRAACAAAGLTLDPVTTESGATALRSAFRCDLVGLATAWTHGAVKAVPTEWQLDGAALRIWVLSAGRPDGRGGYLLGLEPPGSASRRPGSAAERRCGSAEPVGSPGWSSWSVRRRRSSPRPTGRATGAVPRLDGLVTLSRHRSGPG